MELSSYACHSAVLPALEIHLVGTTWSCFLSWVFFACASVRLVLPKYHLVGTTRSFLPVNFPSQKHFKDSSPRVPFRDTTERYIPANFFCVWFCDASGIRILSSAYYLKLFFSLHFFGLCFRKVCSFRVSSLLIGYYLEHFLLLRFSGCVPVKPLVRTWNLLSFTWGCLSVWIFPYVVLGSIIRC